MFKDKRHTDLKKLEEKKLNLEERRFNMETDTIRIKNENLKVQNNVERTKLVLLKLEMFKEREVIKKNNPNITDDYLNSHFPYPE